MDHGDADARATSLSGGTANAKATGKGDGSDASALADAINHGTADATSTATVGLHDSDDWATGSAVASADGGHAVALTNAELNGQSVCDAT